MGLTQEQINTMCQLVDVDTSSVRWFYTPTFQNPYYLLADRTIHISKTDDWREVHQFAHEVMHLSFAEHTNHIHDPDLIWIEEIVCTAFSIYCIDYLCQLEFRLWKPYLNNNVYSLYFGSNKLRRIQDIAELNKHLDGDKDYDVLNFVHPYVLRIYKAMLKDRTTITEFLNYLLYVKDDRVVFKYDIEFTLPLVEIQEKLNS